MNETDNPIPADMREVDTPASPAEAEEGCADIPCEGESEETDEELPPEESEKIDSPAAPDDELLSELYCLREREQDRELLDDPDLGETYAAMRGEVLELTDYCRRGGVAIEPAEAFAALLRQNAGAILRGVRESAAAEAVRTLREAADASPGRLGGGDTPGDCDWRSMSSTDFERQIELARRGELQCKERK